MMQHVGSKCRAINLHRSVLTYFISKNNSRTRYEASLFGLFKKKSLFYNSKGSRSTFLTVEYSSGEHVRFMQAPQIVRFMHINKTSRAARLAAEHVSDVSITSWVPLISAHSLWLRGRLMDAGLQPLPFSGAGSRMFWPPSGPAEVSLSTVVQHSASAKD